MSALEQIPGSFILDGTTCDRKELTYLCRTWSEDPSIPGWRREMAGFILWFLDPAFTFLVQETSGTTGPPKKFTLRKEQMIRSALRTLKTLDLHPGKRVLHCLPMAYIAGKMMVVRAMVGGLDLVPVEPSGRPLRDLDQEIDLSAMVPMQLYESIEKGDPVGRIDRLLVGGGELSADLRRRLALIHRPVVFESFAMTETYTHFALRQVNGRKPDKRFRGMEGVSLALDERGCLIVEVDGVTDGPLVTNDLVELEREGREFLWLGRHDNLISSGGIKIVPEQLEQQIEKILGCECLILPEPDPRLGQQLVLILEEEGPSSDPMHVVELLRKKLHPYQVPKRIIRVDALPRNRNLKPDRLAALRLVERE